MKKILSFLFILICSVSLAACVNDEPTETSGTSTETSTPTSESTSTPTSNPTSTPTSNPTSSSEEPTTPTSSDPDEDDFEQISYAMDLVGLGSGATVDASATFTFTKDGVVEARSKTVFGVNYSYAYKTGGEGNSTKRGINFLMKGNGSVQVVVESRSAGGDKIYLEALDETSTYGKVEKAILSNSGDYTAVTFENVPEGNYAFYGFKSISVYSVVCTCLVPVGSICGFEITNDGTTEFLQGRNYSSTGVAVAAVYTSGRKDVLAPADYSIDSSAYIKNVPGTYSIKVNYANYETQTIDVDVYEITQVNIYLMSMIKKVTTNVKTVFAKNEDFKSDNIVVKALAKKHNDATVTKEFKLDVSEYELDYSKYSPAIAGTYEVKVSSKEVTSVYNTYDVHVVDEATAMAGDVITVGVDANYAGIIGKNVSGLNMFNTIEQALEYLLNSGLNDASRKIIYVANGEYEEKINITIPNLSIIGESKEDTIITFNALNGYAEPGEVGTYETDGSATVTVAEAATGFIAKNITFDNWYNTAQRYATSSAGSSNRQGVALACSADQSIFINCGFSGYQDTLLAAVGRQYYYNCTISGRTDFIFGYNSTVLFKGCTIISVTPYKCETDGTIKKNANDTNQVEANGGYILAPKGIKTDASDAVVYGFIFNDCDFIAEDEVIAGSVAILRPWGTHATVAIINSRIGGHVSKAAYETGATQEKRYVDMSNCKISTNLDTLKLYEYNNTGDGAITESASPCKILTAGEAGDYEDIRTIFDKDCRSIAYAKEWQVPSFSGIPSYPTN